jgi:hypothetical protein
MIKNIAVKSAVGILTVCGVIKKGFFIVLQLCNFCGSIMRK